MKIELLDHYDHGKQMPAARVAFGKATGLLSFKVQPTQVKPLTKSAKTAFAPAKYAPMSVQLQYLAAFYNLVREQELAGNAAYQVSGRNGEYPRVEFRCPPHKSRKP